MKKGSVLFLLLFSCLVAVSQDDISFQSETSPHLLVKTGILYPKMKFLDSRGIRSLNSRKNNVSGDRLAIGFGDYLTFENDSAYNYLEFLSDRLGYSLTASSNRYKIRTFFDQAGGRYNVDYELDYASLDFDLFLNILPSDDVWSSLVSAGLSFNYMISGFQELEETVVDLKENKEFSDSHLDLNLGFSIGRKLTRYSRLWLGYLGKLGVEDEESGSNQRYGTTSHGITIGFSIYPNVFERQKINYDKILEENRCSTASLRSELLLLLEKKIATSSVDGDSEFKKFITLDSEGNSPLKKEILECINNVYSAKTVSRFNRKSVLLFQPNKTEYYPVFRESLEDLLELFLSDPPEKIKVIGYADQTGSDDFNLKLSKERAQMILDFLIAGGVNPEVIESEFRGGTSEFGGDVRMSNRRVEILF